MRCEVAGLHMDALRTDEVLDSERTLLWEHMQTCPDCVRMLAEIEEVALLASQLQVTAPSAVLSGVLAAVGDRYGVVETCIGPVWVGFTTGGVTFVDVGAEDAATFERRYVRRVGRAALVSEVPPRYVQALQRAAAGEVFGAVPVDLGGLPVFEREVLLALADIPRGEVRPYAWLAQSLGRPKAVRATGNALARNPVPLLLPCHRVVPSGGGVGRYIFGSELKAALLGREGVPMDELAQLAREGVRFVGCRSTGVYCFPSCRDARRMRLANRVAFASGGAAVAAGYRPCKHCRPLGGA